MNVANLDTLDDLFENSEQKIKFYQVKRAVYMLDSQRLLSIPMKTGTGNPNVLRENKTFLKHYQTLWRQDGLLKEEVEAFLDAQRSELTTFYRTVRSEEPRSLHIRNLTNAADFDYGNFAHDAQAKVFIKDDAVRQKALADNDRILKELRELEKEILDSERIPYEAYFHPEYFLGYEGLLTSEETLLTRVQTLRDERKSAYLDKGGEILDEWMKRYLSHLLIRQALVHQDLLIRKNIHTIVNATSVEDIKDFVLDPFILKQAKLTISDQYPDQVWKVKSYTLIHKELMNEKSLTDQYFHSNAHSTAFWALLAVSLVLLILPIPGARVASYAISCILLADFGVQIGIELHSAFVSIPESIENKKNFYLSAADSFDEVLQNGVATGRIRGGPGSIQDFENLYDMLFWRRVIAVGSFALFFVPWARAEVRRGVRLFHNSFNLLSAMKIPYYARQFGIETADDITMPLIRKKMAEKLGITTQELMTMNEKQLLEKAAEVFSRGKWTRNQFGWYLSGRHEAEILVNKYNFFHDPIIQRKFLEIELPVIQKRMAEKLGITVTELMGMNEKKLLETASEVFSRERWTRIKFGWYISGRQKAKILVKQYKFLHDPIIQHKLWLRTVDMTERALTTIGVREGVIPTVAEALEQGQKELITLIKYRYFPSGAPEFGKLMAEQIVNVKAAIKYLENHQTFLQEMWYRAHVDQALKTLNLDMAHGMAAETFDAFYITVHGHAEKMMAWRALRPIYEMTPRHMKQFEKQMAKRAADHPSQAAFQALKEFHTSIPR